MPRLALILLVPALGLASCGGDDGPSREDYIDDADAICQRFNERIADVNETQPTDLEGLREVLGTGLEITDQGLEEFEGLEPPEDIEDEVEEFLDAARDQERVLRDARDADSFEEGARILRDRLPPIVQARKDAADEIGFEECGAS